MRGDLSCARLMEKPGKIGVLLLIDPDGKELLGHLSLEVWYIKVSGKDLIVCFLPVSTASLTIAMFSWICLGHTFPNRF